MKDIVREYGKMAGFAAAGAFCLSLLVGLVSRNPFGAALARAFLLAILFACLGAAARYIIAKYLPELVGGAPREGTSGQTIDITLPEESPAAAVRAGAYARASGSRSVRPEAPQESDAADFSSVQEEATVPEETSAMDMGEGGGGSPGDVLGDELDDVLPPLTDAGAVAPAADEQDAGADSVEEAESVGDEGSGESEPEVDEAPETDSDLGRLPDISSLGGVSPGARAAPPRRSPRGGDLSATPEDEMKGALGSQDPATLARAIRTVLKRDEKG